MAYALSKSALPTLPPILHLYVFGIQGFCDEIIFTSVLDLYLGKGNWELRGHSAISSFFIYGVCSFLVQHLYVFLYYKHGIQWYIRQPLYVLIAYSWEFTCGFILRKFNACPWDYSHYTYNFMGLITLEYAPGWLFLAFCQDALADYLLRIRVAPPGDIGEKTLIDLPKREESNGIVSNGYIPSEKQEWKYKFKG